MLKRYFLSLLVCVPFVITGCKQDHAKIPVSSKGISAEEKPVTLHVDRFEKDLFSVPFDSVDSSIPALKAKYGAFFDIFTHKIINIGGTNHPDFPKYLKSFITDRYMYLTYKKVMEVYPDFHGPAGELQDAFSRYHEFFPGKKIPHVYTLISGYNQSVVTADTILGISLDKYLGQNCEYYSNLGLPMYQRKVMSEDYLAVDAMRGWCYSEFLYSDSGENVLTNLLYEGKMIYLLKELFPEKPDTILLGYSHTQLKWCQNNLKEMWTFLIEQKLVFSTDYMTINKLINPAPFTSLFTRESPGRAAIWVGYKIIEAYMKNNDVTLAELMKDQHYQEILEKSKFQP